MADVKISGLHKRYGSFHAVRGIDLEIPDGEFTVLVGPSGCGKSTLLRTIAGLEDITDGEIAIGGEVVNDMRAARPRRRHGVPGLCALPAHDGAREHRLRAEGAQAAGGGDRNAGPTAASMLGITSLLDRLPRQLSGGQRQRVAIGRAIVRNPRSLSLRRAAVQPRRPAARRDARRDQAPAPAASRRR